MPPMEIMEIPKPVASGRMRGGVAAVRMTRAPLVRPDAPTPARARPAMTMWLEMDRAQMRLPSAKTALKSR